MNNHQQRKIRGCNNMRGLLKKFHYMDKGFTLVELLIVVAILGVLAAVVLPNITGLADEGQIEAAKAEMGHLVLTTLHTPGAAETIDRFIDVFPPHQQQQVRIQLATALEGVIYQLLIPRADNSGRVAVFEVMLASPAIRNLIREGKTYQMMNAIQTGTQYGMQTLNQSLVELCQRGMITREQALARSTDTEGLSEMLGGHRAHS